MPRDLFLGNDAEREMFRNYSIALKIWSRKFNTAEIAAHLKQPEHIVQRWIWHWRELSHASTAPPHCSGDRTLSHLLRRQPEST